MRPDAAFTSITAARLWGVPLPAWLPDDTVHVATPHSVARPGGRGVTGSQYRGSIPMSVRHGLRVLDAVETWASLATVLEVADLVAAGDYLVTPPFGSTAPPFATVSELVAAAHRPHRRGRSRAVSAAALVAVGSYSRPESLTRVLAITGGIPAPICNFAISPLITFDLAWPRWSFGLDYHGATHRSATQHAKDVSRHDLAVQHGWDSMQIAAPDLFDAPFELILRIRSRLIERGASLRPFEAHKVARPRR